MKKEKIYNNIRVVTNGIIISDVDVYKVTYENEESYHIFDSEHLIGNIDIEQFYLDVDNVLYLKSPVLD